MTQDIDFRLIKAFCAVYEEGSISKAAARLRIAQPSISVSIRNLEFDLGVTLFDRGAGGVQPTSKAHALYSKLQVVLAGLDAARKAVTGELTDVRGPLRVGLPPAVTRGLLPKLLPEFLSDYPNVEVRIIEGMAQKLIDLTLTGDLDLAVVTLPPIDTRIVSRRIVAEPFVLISARNTSDCRFKPVDLTATAPMKLALLWSQHSLRSMIGRYIDSKSIHIERLVELESAHTILDLVQRSDWHGLLTISAVSGDYHRFQIREIAAPRMQAEYFQIHAAHRTQSAASRVFADVLEKHFEQSAFEWSMRGKNEEG